MSKSCWLLCTSWRASHFCAGQQFKGLAQGWAPKPSASTSLATPLTPQRPIHPDPQLSLDFPNAQSPKKVPRGTRLQNLALAKCEDYRSPFERMHWGYGQSAPQLNPGLGAPRAAAPASKNQGALVFHKAQVVLLSALGQHKMCKPNKP